MPADLGLEDDDPPLRTDGGADADQEPNADDDNDEWNPEPATLREGENRDDTHARRNAEQLRIAQRELRGTGYDAADESGGDG